MIHVAIGAVVLSVTFVVLAIASLFVPGAPSVDAVFVSGALASLVTSGAFLWCVRRWNL